MISAILACWECCVHFWPPQYKKDMDTLDRVLQRTVNKMKGLEWLSCEDKAERTGVVQLGEQKVQCT